MADITDLRILLCELKLMIYIGSHDNIVNLIGARTEGIYKRELLIAMELCENGSLLNYIVNHKFALANQSCPTANSQAVRTSYVDITSVVSPPLDLMRWAHEIAEGMLFLSRRKVLHGDLAARNILLTKDLTAKISDFGLSHQLVNYYTFVPDGDVRLPLKWLAIECLENRQFSTGSDIWAYGVTLWEMFSLGDAPWSEFSDIDIGEILRALKDGRRLEKPHMATQIIYDKILECWNECINDRPSFEDLAGFFTTQEQLLNTAT